MLFIWHFLTKYYFVWKTDQNLSSICRKSFFSSLKSYSHFYSKISYDFWRFWILHTSTLRAYLSCWKVEFFLLVLPCKCGITWRSVNEIIFFLGGGNYFFKRKRNPSLLCLSPQLSLSLSSLVSQEYIAGLYSSTGCHVCLDSLHCVCLLAQLLIGWAHQYICFNGRSLAGALLCRRFRHWEVGDSVYPAFPAPTGPGIPRSHDTPLLSRCWVRRQ